MSEDIFIRIGDNGYTPSSILLTAVAGAQRGTPEYRFSDTLRRTRCRSEQTFGIWKQIMRCINGERCLVYEPHFGADIVLCAGVLYNFLRHHGYALRRAWLCKCYLFIWLNCSNLFLLVCPYQNRWKRTEKTTFISKKNMNTYWVWKKDRGLSTTIFNVYSIISTCHTKSRTVG